MSTNAIEIRGLTKKFPNFTLGPIDLTVPTGAIYGYIGPNGSGKTTTIDLIFGMGAKDGGSIEALGLDHEKNAVALKRQVGYVSPDTNYQAWRTVARAIQFVKGFYPTWDESYCDRLLGNFGLKREENIAALSFGSRIKLALLLALSWRPRMLILDEPTVGLDAVTKQAVFAELLAMVEEGDRTVFISSHGLGDIERFADHIGMIKNGQILIEGGTATIMERFQMIDFVVESQSRFGETPGIYPQNKESNRWRALVDAAKAPSNWLAALGGRQLAAAPVTLEELFIALAKD